MKCTSPVSFKLDFFSCSSPVSRWPRKTCFPKKKIKVREVPHCSRLFKISLRVPAPYPYKWCHIAFQNKWKGKVHKNGHFSFCGEWMLDNGDWRRGKKNLSRLTLLVASSARKLEITPLESATTELSSFKIVRRNCQKEEKKMKETKKHNK